MELLDGATPRECLAAWPSPMATGEVLDMVLLPDGQVKVLDFGLANRVADETEKTRTVQALRLARLRRQHA